MSDTSSSNIPIKLLSEALSQPIVNTYKAGGLGLALLLIGSLLTLVAFFFGPSPFGYAILFLGVFIILVIVFRFYLQGIRPLQHTEARIKNKKNEEIVNTVQQAAIDAVVLARDWNELTLVHVGEVTDFIVQYQQIAEETLPYVQQVATRLKIPGAHKIGEMVNNKYVLKEKALLASILLITNKTKDVLENVKDALSQSNIEPLKAYQGQLKEASQNVQELLKEVNNSKLRDQSD